MKFQIKMTICMVCLLSVLFGIGGTVLLSNTFAMNLEREREKARNAYQTVLNALQLVDEFDGVKGNRRVDSVVEQLSDQGSSEWAAIRLTVGNEVIYKAGEQADFFRDFDQPLEQDSCFIVGMADTTGRYLQASGIFSVGGKTLRLDIASDSSDAYYAQNQQLRTYLLMFVGMLIVCAAMSYGMSGLLTRPLTQLTLATQKIADGDFNCRTGIQTGDEIGVLSEKFDQMADQVEKNIEHLRDAVERQKRFMGMFAHELKTPMTSIIGYADLLRGGTLDEEEQASAANYIFAEGKRVESLSFKLLDLLVAEKRELRLTAASPSRLLTEVARYWEPERAQRGIVLEVRCEDGQCLMDTDLIRSLILNLLDNAKKAMDGPGTICLANRMTSDGCVLEVRDTGRGIPQEAIFHLTEAFYRVDKSRSRALGGAGLGLTLCSEIVHLHGGQLEFESREGEGTCVRAVLRRGRP